MVAAAGRDCRSRLKKSSGGGESPSARTLHLVDLFSEQISGPSAFYTSLFISGKTKRMGALAEA